MNYFLLRPYKWRPSEGSLVDKYIDSGYEFIIPPLLELSETIGGEAHDEIKSHAFSFRG